MSERGVDPGAHSEELAIQAARVAEQMKASDIIVLDVGDVLSIAGYFVIASASNQRLVRAVAEEVESQLKVSFDRPPVRVEGLREREWTLIDYGDVVVHVFYEPTREFYEIERLYMDAPSVEWAPTEVTVDES
ncbi:MAG: ribosome silencing factor [Ilumatobacteraceae bacterium]|nr:ribosome silencing factor [Ilumatobacteraceae bacterium]